MKSIRFVSWIILPVLTEEYSGTSADACFLHYSHPSLPSMLTHVCTRRPKHNFSTQYSTIERCREIFLICFDQSD
ncbi:hypothetical protein B0H13DRAFT_1965911 [Mycena leptocephala]|nr:hypothetical protein B0H13DRAFT_1965911 [Mycena leptocephala]